MTETCMKIEMLFDNYKDQDRSNYGISNHTDGDHEVHYDETDNGSHEDWHEDYHMDEA